MVHGDGTTVIDQDAADPFPATPLGRQLQLHVQTTLLDGSPGADTSIEESLAQLRRSGDDLVAVIVATYEATATAAYFDRWLLVKTLGDLGLNSAYEPLRLIAFALPDPTVGDEGHPHGRSHAFREATIRMRAVDGLATLALSGHEGAEEALLELATRPADDAARTRAIKGYLAAGADTATRVEKLRAMVPREFFDVVTLAKTDPATVSLSPPPGSGEPAHITPHTHDTSPAPETLEQGVLP